MKTSRYFTLLISIILLAGFTQCTTKIERSGFVLDAVSKEPIEGVSVEIYMKYQRKDSLAQKVLTDANGYFYIKEKRNDNQLFAVRKKGYIGYISALSVPEDTVFLELEN